MKKTTNPGVGAEWKLSPKARLVPKHLRHEVAPDAMEPRNIKVRVSIYLDLDVLDFFKALAKDAGALPYQTQINAALRGLVETAQSGTNDAAATLRQAKGLIDAAIRKIG
jgi:uncharacterized protein (DUF4415 family)